MARSHALLGRTVDDGRIWDIAATARFLINQYDGKVRLHIVGEGAGAVLGAYAMLLESEIAGAILDNPHVSHMDATSPALLNVLRVCDVPDALGALAPRSLRISGLNRKASEKVTGIFTIAGVSEKLIQFK